MNEWSLEAGSLHFRVNNIWNSALSRMGAGATTPDSLAFAQAVHWISSGFIPGTSVRGCSCCRIGGKEEEGMVRRTNRVMQLLGQQMLNASASLKLSFSLPVPQTLASGSQVFVRCFVANSLLHYHTSVHLKTSYV